MDRNFLGAYSACCLRHDDKMEQFSKAEVLGFWERGGWDLWGLWELRNAECGMRNAEWPEVTSRAGLLFASQGL
jgi:hypothetical protein